MPSVIVDRKKPGITHIKLNRAEKRNALNCELLQSLIEHIEETYLMKDQRVIVFSGEGSVFCSGMDLSEREDKGQLIADLFNLIYFSPLVTIASVQGAALAGGAGLMAACDLVTAHPDTQFGFPETHRGLVPAQVMTFLVSQLSIRDLKELLLLGEMIDATKALELGLINRISDDPLRVAHDLADQAMQGAPLATQMTKQLLNELDPSFPEDLQNALSYHHRMLESEEAQEGISAFLEKRSAKW